MLSSYDLTSFSNRLRTIRKSLGYSQIEVFEKTGINSDTLRRLENGLSIPRFDTLEVLSQFYKENLILLLDSYKTSSHLSYFYDLVDYHIANDNYKSIKESIDLFEDFSRSNDYKLIDQKELIQLQLFFKALDLICTDEKDKYQKSIDALCKALQISLPLFKIEKWNNYKYNFLELRILLTIASFQGVLRNCKMSTDILLFILKYLDHSKHAKYYEKLLIIKCYSTISYNYHRLDKHSDALKYSEIGIEFCIENSIMTYLALLLSRKAVAMIYLKQEGFEKFFFQGIELLRIQKNESLAQEYEKILHQYLIKAQELNKKSK